MVPRHPARLKGMMFDAIALLISLRQAFEVNKNGSRARDLFAILR